MNPQPLPTTSTLSNLHPHSLLELLVSNDPSRSYFLTIAHSAIEFESNHNYHTNYHISCVPGLDSTPATGFTDPDPIRAVRKLIDAINLAEARNSIAPIAACHPDEPVKDQPQ